MKPTFLVAFTFLFFSVKITFSQITVNNNAPYNTATFLIDSLLLGEGVIASNHAFQGDSAQIGLFNGINSNIGLDSGIVMSTGGIKELVPGFLNQFINNNVNDPDLLDLANSVPPLIGQNFTVTSVNDIANLEFDFVPVSSHMSFKYIFASKEYFTYENTQFNDVFGFFISGPNIAGPYSSPPEFPNGSINIATFQSVE
ncbi:MAG: choice-of-anchor L domain-containing protein, partial [Flavobacteriales bacterium]